MPTSLRLREQLEARIIRAPAVVLVRDRVKPGQGIFWSCLLGSLGEQVESFTCKDEC